MLSILGLCLLCGSSWALYKPQYYSYSAAVGGGSGTSYASDGEGRITAVRVWEISGSYITGFQLRYEYAWSPRYGREVGTPLEMSLFEGEAIVQVSGKYNPSNYIYQLVFVTSRGRSFIVGQPVGTSFNFYPVHSESELRFLSGRFNGNGITSMGAHWAMVDDMPSGPAMMGNNTMPALT
ncbi:zymogen granule membrane protein 16-like [Megalops cyprinoides]|uniref:zymogen granule membrane protein 16-like n=1 Tax=Megalops cyprinoides TaxID=118141 RepID=UPI001864A74F|nr:zymogen granule membrane protein 16-like [Megalops cyprinoides]